MRLSGIFKVYFSFALVVLFSFGILPGSAFSEVGDRADSTLSSKPERLDRKPTAQEIQKRVAGLKTYWVSYFPGTRTQTGGNNTAAKKPSEGNPEKGQGLREEYTTAFDPIRNEAMKVPRLVGDGEEIGKGKKDNETVTKLELSEISTLCIPGCDPEKDAMEQAVCVIIDTKDNKRYDFKCGKEKNNFGKNGFVGPVQLAVDIVLGKAIGVPKKYTVTEVIVGSGKVEKVNYAYEYRDGKLTKVPHSAHYLGSTSPKDQNPNREKSDSCGFMIASCFVPNDDWWDDHGDGSDAQVKKYGPCNDAAPPTTGPPSIEQGELVLDGKRTSWTKYQYADGGSTTVENPEEIV